MDEALYDSFRFNLSRQIVGEVRGREVIAMIKAMESGAGSISTTHAANAEAALRKLVTCAMEAGAHVTHEYATRAIAENIDLVVQLQLETTPLAGGAARRDRWLSEIIAVTPVSGKYATTHVFSAGPAGSRSPGCCPMSTGIWSGMASICPASTPNPARWRRDSAHPGAGRGAAGRRPDRHRRRAPPDPETTSGAATSAGWVPGWLRSVTPRTRILIWSG